MKKNILLFIIGLLIIPTLVEAEQLRYSVTATCKNNYNYDLVYDNPKTYICSNGNKSPYTRTVEDTCKEFTNKVCNIGTIKSCYVVLDYDCSRTSSGAKFTTTKKTTKSRTTKKSTTTTITTAVIINTKLKSLSLSSGNIVFSPDTYEYSINVESTVSSIDVTAIPEDENSKVEIQNNTNIENGSVISIIVTGSDNSTTEYSINVSKEVYIMSSNAKLSSLSVKGYSIPFNSKINEYPIKLDDGVKELDIDYEVEDEKAVVSITGNENLTDGSRVTITVTAEDGTENVYVLDISLKEKSNAISIIFIIILILALIAGGYYVYKKFIQSKMGEKYEYE